MGADVWFGRVAGYDRLELAGSTSWLDHTDAVGTLTMQTDPTGAETWDVTHYAWGQHWQQTGSHPSGGFYADLEFAINDPEIPSATREYNPGYYRWLTPDPGGRKVVKLDNPQTWNMYAYALDNPTTLNDPSGMAANGCGKESHNVCPKQPLNGLLKGHGAQEKIKSAKVAEAGALATAGCLAAEPCGAAETVVTVAVGAVTTGYYLYKNKHAIKQVMGQVRTATGHIAKLNDPSHDPNDRRGWRGEVQAAIKRAKVWQNRMSPGLWKDAMGALIDQVQSALPGE